MGQMPLFKEDPIDVVDVATCEETGPAPALDAVEKGMKDILIGMGIDLNDPNFTDTPRRVAKSFAEIFKGLFPEAKKELETQLSVTFPCDYKGMIVISDIHVWSMCPHHFLPVDYNISIGYIPNGQVLGASKLPRIATLLAKKPILQEQLTEDIVNHLQRIANPLGVIVIVKGQHLCMRMRGIKSETSAMITSSITGVFKDEPSAKEEFFTILNTRKQVEV